MGLEATDGGSLHSAASPRLMGWLSPVNAYSGNNGRAAIMNEEHSHVIYTPGNAGNGANPQPDGIIAGAGAQIVKPTREPEPELLQEPGFPTPVGSFNITQLGDNVHSQGLPDGVEIKDR